MKSPISLRLLIMQTGTDNWVAVSLEHYIMAQSQSVDGAVQAFQKTLIADVAFGVSQGNGDQPLAGIAAAPAKYWDAYEKALPVDRTAMSPHIDVQGSLRIPIEDVREVRLAH